MSTFYYTPPRTLLVASAYGSSTYDVDNYSGTSTTGSGSVGGGSSVLTDTGIAVAAIVSVAAVIMMVSIVVRIWKRSRKAAAAKGSADE